MRTAAAMSVDRLWLVGATPPLSHPKVQKTALGTQRYLTWTTTDTIADAVAGRNADGYAVVGVELADTAVPLPELDLPDGRRPRHGPRGPRAEQERVTAVRSPRVHPAAREDRVAQRGHGHRHRDLRRSPAVVGLTASFWLATSAPWRGLCQPETMRGCCQRRRGSTAIRSRPPGRGVAASASSSGWWAPARNIHSPSVGPITSTPDRVARARPMNAGAAAPDTTATAA